MFGLIDSERSDDATGRVFRGCRGRRRFRGYGDVDLSPLIIAGINLTAGLVQTGVKIYANEQERQRQEQAANACASYGPGYYYNAATGQCVAPPSAAGSFLSSLDPTTVAIGVGVLAVLFMSGRN